jgi:hypothetical protein
VGGSAEVGGGLHLSRGGHSKCRVVCRMWLNHWSKLKSMPPALISIPLL